jgi:heme o synthase
VKGPAQVRTAAGETHLRSGVLSGYLALTKPGLTTLSVCTAVGGAYLAPGGLPSALLILNLVVGTFLVGAGAGALNQLIERRTDALMKRTERRPVPSGEIAPLPALAFGSLCAVGGCGYLYALTTPAAGILAVATLLVYLAAYTPLKRVTHLSTAVGGIPGALPPLIGWVATGRGFCLESYLLFLFLFLWQMPHFLALAWMYRLDYERGGYRLLPLYDASGGVTGRLVVLYAAALIPVVVALTIVGLMGWVFLAGAVVVGGVFLAYAIRFARAITNDNARRLFLSSLVYLSVVMVLMLVDRVVLQ